MSDLDIIEALRAEIKELQLNQKMFTETLDQVSRDRDRLRALVTTAETVIRENNVIIDELRELVEAVGEDVCKQWLRLREKDQRR